MCVCVSVCVCFVWGGGVGALSPPSSASSQDLAELALVIVSCVVKVLDAILRAAYANLRAGRRYRAESSEHRVSTRIGGDSEYSGIRLNPAECVSSRARAGM